MKLMRLGALGYALISIYLWSSEVTAAIVNGTIDDRFGDSVTHRLVNYYPSPNSWYNESCSCGLDDIDKSQAFDNTYTVKIYAPPHTGPVGSIGINMQFIGTAIYVFFILANFIYKPTLNSANFSVDGNAPVLFETQIPALPTLTPQYNVLAFSQTNLSNTLHTLNISTSGFYGPIYVNFDYAIYTYDDGVSTTSSLSLLSAATTTSQAPSTPVTGAPAQRIPVGAIVGGIAGGITLLVLVIALLFCWLRRGGHGALQSVKKNRGLEALITEFNGGGGSLPVSASGMPYTQPLAVRSKSPMATVTVSGDTDNQANMHNRYRTFHSGGVVLSPPGSQQLPSSSENALPSLTSNVLVTTGDNRSASPLLPPPLNVTGTREVRRARQEDLDNQLRVVQHNIVQLEESSVGPGRSVSLRRQTSGEAEIIEEEMQMSMPDIQEAIRSLREQIRILREQQQSAWAQGLSNDRPPGYTPM